MIKDLRPALRAFLLADNAIATAVGSARIYPLVLLQGQKAASVVYSRISGLGDHHMQGASGLSQPRFQIDAWATTQDAAAALADLIKDRLDGFRGLIESDASPPAFTPIRVQGAFFESEREDYDPAAEMFRVSRDYLIWFEER